MTLRFSLALPFVLPTKCYYYYYFLVSLIQLLVIVFPKSCTHLMLLQNLSVTAAHCPIREILEKEKKVCTSSPYHHHPYLFPCLKAVREI